MTTRWIWMLTATMAAAATAQTTRPAATAEPATTAPATRPADAATTQPALTQEVEQLLDTIEAAGKKFRMLTADVRYDEEELLFGDKTTYTGKVYYRTDADPKRPAWFRIHFDKITAGNVTVKKDRDYAFITDGNGQWLISRNEKTKQYIRRQVARPGEQINPLKLEQAIFPLPFGQKKADVLELFAVSTRPLERGDPKKTTYLKLTPKPRSEKKLKVSFVELWVGPDGLPVQIRTEDVNGETRQTARFTDIDRKADLSDKDFQLPRPRLGSGWEIRTEPLPKDR